MAKTLVKGGTTPNGFGIRLHSSGGLRASSPCCDRSMDGVPTNTLKCRGCGKTYPTLPMWNMTSEIFIVPEDLERTLSVEKFSLINWARSVTGYPELTMEVKF